jgi:hypothetical protein
VSSEDRLTRLGLLHLIDKPDELRAELERRVAVDEIRQREIEAEMAEIRRRLTAPDGTRYPHPPDE